MAATLPAEVLRVDLTMLLRWAKTRRDVLLALVSSPL